MGNKINVMVNDLFSMSVEIGTPLYDIAHDYKKVTGKTVIGCRLNGEVTDLNDVLTNDADVKFFDFTDEAGNKMYVAGLKFVLQIAAKELWNKDVYFRYSLEQGLYTEIDKKVTDEDIYALRDKMEEIINYDYPIKKCITKKEDGIKYYQSIGETEKADNINFIPNNYIELYEINHKFNYFYSKMPYSTGELHAFDLERVGKNSLILKYPRIGTKHKIPEFYFNEKIYEVLQNNVKWGQKMNVSYVSDLNKLIYNAKIQMFIKMNNIHKNDSLNQIAKDIEKKNKKVKLILIGGPSSSGKTTTAHKLCTYLEARGIKPIVLSADDYFKERIETPKDKNGNYDFECLEAIDLELFNDQLKRLLNKEEVKIPTFNFLTGEKEYKRSPIKLNDDNILLIEGLHCLNDEMTSSINRENKYKLYVSPFTSISIDKHNHVSTRDMRLMRRITRDNRTRGYKVEDTLKNWSKVKLGEEKYIFPYTGDVDAILNTAHVYEMGVLKVFVEPLLYSVPRESKYYEDAQRLLGVLRAFFPISSEYIEDDNILREFIGGSIYEI